MRAWAWWFALVGAVAVARELDPAACSARFDVQRDKIIRTEESRDMGARYLSELDVGTREECLRLCCETDSCDVFVYEEKRPGSCYMFNCGPPEDFRCKFTAHSNFSSGVLALSRRLAELQDQEHHERQLASLRNPTTTTPSTTTLAPPHAPPSDPPQQLPPGRCSRYQFECRRGGECIAVYNACDGIPQCADGSDEAPELGCPAAPVPPAPPLPAPTPPPQPPITTPPPAPVVPVKPGQAQLVESSESGVSEGMLDIGAGAGDWPHRLSQVQPQHRYNDPARSSHIFSHKGGLLQEADQSLAQYPSFEQPWPRRTWPQAPQPVMEWSGGPGMGGGMYARPADWAEPDPRRAWPVPQRPDPDMSIYMPAKTMPELPMVYSSQQQTLRDSPKKGYDLERRPAPTQPPSASPPAAHDKPVLDNTTKKKDLARPASSSTSSARHAEGVHEHFVGDEHEHDGLSEHPPSAILLLVLGVAMTAAMGGMLGCRARAARRRLRRGKAGLAHDADYLVNGMYL
ncbi:uncharacterized protein LOC128676660 isoform X2 [Plodia interpunctella]|uniref:uncharacterized protein LOC128676660 isoform X2 n=1 Tax=Plodia interpunctella TaxID=58824 RepID=UPI002367DFCA|nr:uncharacterized protein LOC128676660 isoform X2 [Plodia interpunctella]